MDWDKQKKTIYVSTLKAKGNKGYEFQFYKDMAKILNV